MAITVTSNPERVLLSRNPIIFGLDTDNYMLSAGVKAYRRIQFDTSPSAGDTLEFYCDLFPGGVITFTYASSPDDSGLQLPEGPGGSGTVAYSIDLIPYFLANPYVNQYFEVYNDSGASISFRAREVGVDYDFSFIHSGYSVTGTGAISGADPSYTEDYRVRARLVIDKGYGDRIYSDYVYKIPDADGSLSWDFSELVEDLFPRDINPELSLSSMLNFKAPPDTGTINCWVEFAEHYGADPFTNVIKVSREFRVARGGFRSYDKEKSLITVFSGGKKFLTWRESGIYTYQDAYDWLHFIHYDPTEVQTTLLLQYEAWFTDGTSNSGNLFASYSLDYDSHAYDNFNIFTIPAGYAHSGIALFNPGKTPYKYRIRVAYTGAVAVADWFTFNVLPPSKLRLSFSYLNSFGMEETICVDGEKQMAAAAGYETLRLKQIGRSSEIDLKDLDYNHILNSTIEVSTGGLSRKSAQALQDLLLSPKVYLHVNQGSSYMRFACRLDQGDISAQLKDNDATNVIPNTLKFKLNEEREYSNINKVWE